MLKWFFVALLLACPFASADDFSLTLSGGYSHLELANQRLPGQNNYSGYFYEKDGNYVDADAALRIRSATFPLQLGGGLSWFVHDILTRPLLAIRLLAPTLPTLSLFSRI